MGRLNRLDKDYYKQNVEKMFKSISEPQFRIFKVINEDESVWQNQRPITSPQKLLSLLKNKPMAVYYSVGYFLNPHKVRGNKKRAGYVIADNLFLFSDLFFDCDCRDDLRVAQEDTVKIMDYMKKEPYALVNCQFSGTKGFHLLYKPLERIKEPHPIKRRELYQTEHERIIEGIKKLELKTYDIHHYNLIKDPFRVYAVAHSIKSNSGNKVTPLTEKEIRSKDIYSVLHSKGITVLSEVKTNEKEVAVKTEVNTSALTYRGKKRPQTISSLTFKQFFYIDNMVKGLKNNYVVVIKQHEKQFSEGFIKLLQKDYRLSDFFIFSVGNYRYSICLKCVQIERLSKILSRVNSTQLSLLLTKKHLPIILSDVYDENVELIDKFNFIRVVKSEFGRNDNHSLPHYKIFKDIFSIKQEYSNLRGSSDMQKGLMRVA